MNIPYGLRGALQQFTRIPVQLSDFDESRSTEVLNYLPLIGLILAIVLGTQATMLSAILPPSMLVLVLIITAISFTGCLHEDGFADVCDSLGAFDREKANKILKDSRLGTYGVCGLTLSLGIRITGVFLLLGKTTVEVFAVLICVLIVSRITPLILARKLSYTGSTRISIMFKKNQIKVFSKRQLVALLFPIVVGSYFFVGISILVSYAVAWSHHKWLQDKFGGYNGDVLGYSVILTECLLWLLSSAMI